MKINYFKLREMYNDNELIGYLYNYYYYIVDKVYYRNNETIKRELIESKLKELIINYINDDNKIVSPSKYIHNKIVCFESTFRHNELKKKKFELTKNAYLGDTNARQQIFMNYVDKIDNKAEDIFSTLDKNNSIIMLDDIKQMMYLDMWTFVNSFYDRENKGIYFSTEFMTRLNNLSYRIINYLNKELVIQENVNIENVNYSDSCFKDTIDNKEILDIISSELPNKYKFVLGYLRQGYTYEYSGSMVGISSQRVNEIINKIKRIVKKKDIRW